MKCPKCGEPIRQGARFCARCGEDFASHNAAVGNRRNNVLVAVVAAVVTAVVALGAVVLFAPAPKTAGEDQTQTQDGQASKDAAKDSVEQPGDSAEPAQDAVDAQKETQAEPAPEEPAANPVADVVAAYEAVLNNVSPYFADAWYDQYPDGDYLYALADMNGDDIPELLVSNHYSNVGSHTSGGVRYQVFVYDASTGQVQVAQSDEFAVFMEAWTNVLVGEDHHSLVSECRYFRGMDTVCFRMFVAEDGSLQRTEIGSEATGEPIQDYDLSDRAPLQALLS